jgi:hypothetical protein
MNDLDKMAEKIAELHATVRLLPTLETAAAIGELLAEVKASLPHGEWMPWLRSWLPHVSTRTARAEERAEARERLLAQTPADDERYTVHHCDCRWSGRTEEVEGNGRSSGMPHGLHATSRHFHSFG